MEKETIEINILGDTRREEWHSVVNILRQNGRHIAEEAYNDLLSEIDRYIDRIEDYVEWLEG